MHNYYLFYLNLMCWDHNMEKPLQKVKQFGVHYTYKFGANKQN